MRIYRFLSLTIAVIMCFSLFVGCKRDVKTEPPDTDGTSADTTAKPTETTPPETNPPEPPVTALELGEDGYAGSYSALPLIHFNYPDVKAANIPKGINVVGIVETLTEFEAFMEKYINRNTVGSTSQKIRERFQLCTQVDSFKYRVIIISVPVPPQQNTVDLYSASDKKDYKLEMNVRCFSDRWEIDLKNAPPIDESEEKYAGYTFYVITNEITNNKGEYSHNNYLISNIQNNNVKGMSEITDFIQYQFRIKNSLYLLTNTYVSIKDKEDLVNTRLFWEDHSNGDFPVSPTELINQFDEKFCEKYSVYSIRTKYANKDSAFKVTKVFADERGIATFYDGAELEYISPEIDIDEYALATLIFVPKNIGKGGLGSQMIFQQDPAK